MLKLKKSALDLLFFTHFNPFVEFSLFYEKISLLMGFLLDFQYNNIKILMGIDKSIA